jgi:pimeloyl-ACP methyl ester carboxylesterase
VSGFPTEVIFKHLDFYWRGALEENSFVGLQPFRSIAGEREDLGFSLLQTKEVSVTASASSFRSQRSHLASTALWVALSAVPACGTRLQPTVIEVSDRAVEVVDVGHGATTVVFEAGLGDDWTSWDQVANQVAKSTRVFAYSRPGYGQSEASEEPREGSQIVEDLRTILAAQDVKPPYVLVGHSFGGAYMELFAKAHPSEVVGVVLVEPRHRDFLARCEASHLDGCAPSSNVLAGLPQVQRDEFAAFVHIADEIVPLGGFGAYPVRVLTGTLHWGYGPTAERLWESLGASLAEEAADGQQQVFNGAGHCLQNERSEIVTDVILKLVWRAR